MQQRIGKLFTISIFSAACFCLPATGRAQTAPTTPGSTAGSAVPDSSEKLGDAADRTGANKKKDATGQKNKQELPPAGDNAQPLPTK